MKIFKYSSLISALILFISGNIFSQDTEPAAPQVEEKKSAEYHAVNGLENWTYDYDISGLEDGKYNLIIRSRDKAGNISIDGPINLFIDSESDLPVVSISSPSRSMRVGGDFNIVGTATDDDGVASVEVKLDDGSWVKAEGTLFWSSFIETAGWEDGRHRIYAKATDVNGLTGNEISVDINLDKIKPVISIDSHSNGEILSGRKKISGTVADANGVSKLEYSFDGEIWEELKLSGKEEHTERNFSLDVDTRDNEGGTSYIRFRTIDGTGSDGSTVFVYYSDNEKPRIEIISPTEDEILNGLVTVTGVVSDEVGIASFSYIADGNEETEIPLIPGNPYWSRTFDFTGAKGGTVEFKAVDLSGNTEELRLKLKLNPDEDLPVISLVDFEPESFLDSDETILKGIVRDDDGVSSVGYSVDGAEPVVAETSGPFVLPMDELAPGKHTIEIFGTDIYDTRGDSYKYTFLIEGGDPVLIPTEYTRDKEILPWFDGAVFQQGKTAKINGRVEGGEGEIILYYSISGQEEGQVKVSKGLFSFSVPGKPEPGSYDLTMKAVDSNGRESLINSRIYFAPAPEKDEEFAPVQQDREGLVLIDSRIGGSDPANITSEMPLTGYLVGDSVRTVELDPPQSSFSTSKEGNGFTIIPSGETEPVRFVVKVTGSSGKEYTSPEIYAGSDNAGPAMEMEEIQVPVLVEKESLVERLQTDDDGNEMLVEEVTIVTEIEEIASSMIEESLILKGIIKEVSGIAEAKVSFSGSSDSYSSPRDIDLVPEEGIYKIDEEFDLSSLAEGEHFISITIKDSLGNRSRRTYPFILDRTAPEVKILSPGSEQPVEGIITVSGYIEDFNRGGELFFSTDSLNFVPVEMTSHNTFTHDIDLSAEGSDSSLFQFKAIDSGRNVKAFTPVFNVDLEADRPVAAIEIPSDGSTIRNDFAVTGLVFDDDAVESIYYSLDGGEYVRIDGNFYYNIPFALSELDEGKHEISIYAEDSGGFPSEPVSSQFLISKAEPVSTLLSPTIEDYTKASILLEGESFDENGIESVYVSYDNGVTFNEATIIPGEEQVPAGEAEVVEDVEAVEEETNKDEATEGDESAETGEQSENAEPEEVVFKTVKWVYTFDTRLPGDGTHSLLIKAVDRAGTVGISSTIINVDNTNPEIKLDSPGESGLAAGDLVIDGKVFDGTRIKSVVSEIQALDDPEFEPLVRDIDTDGVFREIYDVSSYKPGWYNLNLTVTDFADNSISETRNLRIVPVVETESVDIFFPEEGKEFAGSFAIDGILRSADKKRVVLKVDDETFETAEVDENGLFSFRISEGGLSEGRHTLKVESGDGETIIESNKRSIIYRSTGPWVSVDNMISGQFVAGRPMVTGSAGYSGFSEDEKDKSKNVDRVEISLDNGRTFSKAKGREEWEFRLETYDLPEGINQLLIRAFFRDGSVAVSKLFVNIDETAPKVDLFTPEENRTFNGSIEIVGTAGDENGLSSVEVLIREGSKERYEVPSFIQGLYLDFHALGSTYGEIGVGLSFFDDVVKLQAQAGLAPPGRFTGIVFGVKLLATILDVPFSYFFGYDWDFFSMSLAIGANFNYFTMSPDGYYFTSEGVVLGSVLLQYEFAKFEVESLPVFNSYSFYVEGGLWFISSDIQAGITPTVSFGARIGIF